MTAPNSPPIDEGAAPIGSAETKKQLGRPKLPDAQAGRIREVLHMLLREKYDGNKAALARAIGRSSTAVADLLEGSVNASFVTTCAIARLAGCTEGDLLFGDRAIIPPVNEVVDPHPNRTSLLRRLEGLIPVDLVRAMHQQSPIGAADLSEAEWFDRLVALKVSRALGALAPLPKKEEG